MTRKSVVAFVSLGFLISSIHFSAPASAIFGLSNCEKVKNKIKKEEDIQKYAWTNFNKGRNQSLVDGQMNWKEYRENLYRLGLVLESDLFVFDSVKKNPNCFKPESVAAVREKITELDAFFKRLDQELKMIDKTTSAVQLMVEATEQQEKYIAKAYKNAPTSWLRILK